VWASAQAQRQQHNSHCYKAQGTITMVSSAASFTLVKYTTVSRGDDATTRAQKWGRAAGQGCADGMWGAVEGRRSARLAHAERSDEGRLPRGQRARGGGGRKDGWSKKKWYQAKNDLAQGGHCHFRRARSRGLFRGDLKGFLFFSSSLPAVKLPRLLPNHAPVFTFPAVPSAGESFPFFFFMEFCEGRTSTKFAQVPPV
jgi:hypothetical protein